jgi:hypothetical protein
MAEHQHLSSQIKRSEETIGILQVICKVRSTLRLIVFFASDILLCL